MWKRYVFQSKYYSLKILFFSAKDVPAEISFLRYIYLFICSILCLFPENQAKLKLCAQTAQLSGSVTTFEPSWGNWAWSAWRWLKEVSSGRRVRFFCQTCPVKGQGTAVMDAPHSWKAMLLSGVEQFVRRVLRSLQHWGPGLPCWGAGSWARCRCDSPWGRLRCVPRGNRWRLRGKAEGFAGYEAHPVHLRL